MSTEGLGVQLVIGKGRGLDPRTGTIANTLRAARTQHPTGDAAAAITVNAAFEGNDEGYLIVAGAENELGGTALLPPLPPGEVRMATLQSRTDQTMTFLIPMEDDPSIMIGPHCEHAHDEVPLPLTLNLTLTLTLTLTMFSQRNIRSRMLHRILRLLLA